MTRNFVLYRHNIDIYQDSKLIMFGGQGTCFIVIVGHMVIVFLIQNDFNASHQMA